MGKKKLKLKSKKKPFFAKKDKIKVLAYCDSPTCATGFGAVARNILMGLYNTGRYSIDILGINYWGDPHNFPFRIWPTGINNEKDPYGRQKVLNMIPKMDFDILFLMQDSFILDFVPNLLKRLKAEKSDFVSVCYFPVDCTIKKEWLDNVTCVDVPVTYTNFAYQECLKVNPDLKDILKVIPHGVDLTTFYPVNKEKTRRFREAYFSFQADKFIYMNLNRNQQRKDIPRSIMAFKEVRKSDPDTILYLHCLAEGTKIRVFNGVKNIEDITIGDVVLTSTGTFRKVYEKSARPLRANEKVLDIKVVGSDSPITITSDHKVLAIKPVRCSHVSNGICNDNCGTQWVYRKDSWISNCKERFYNRYVPEWVSAGELSEEDYLLIPRIKNINGSLPSELEISAVFDLFDESYVLNDGYIKTSNHPNTKSVPNKICITNNLMKLFGFFISEGCVRSNMDTIQFTFNINEREYHDFVLTTMKNIFGIGGKKEDFPERNATRLTFCCTVLAKFFKYLFGNSASTKKYPEWFNFLDDSLFFALLRGMFDGDGYYDDKYVSYSTISSDLLYLMRDGLIRRGIFAAVRGTYKPDKTFNGYTLTIYTEVELFKSKLGYEGCRSKNRNNYFYHFNIDTDEFVACKIISIKESDYKGLVYNLSVEEDESYCANGFIVHNCAVKDVGHELDKVVQSFGFTLSDVVFPQNFGPNQGFPIETVNMIYNAVDVVISTTLGEGFGNSWIESLATKTPVIMPENTAMAEFITEDIGYLVRSGSNPSLFTVLPYDNEMIRPLVDVEHLVETMLHVKNNYDEALEKAENAYKFLKENLTWQNHVVPRWVELFDKALVRDFDSPTKKPTSDKVILTESF